MKIGIGSDHAGTDLKQLIFEMLVASGHQSIDYGPKLGAKESVDYPDFAKAVCVDVASGKLDSGILICGTGIGMAISANKINKIRAAVLTDEFSAQMSKAHNNINVACLGSRVLDPTKAKQLVHVWLDTAFEGGRHTLRLAKIDQLETQNKKL